MTGITPDDANSHDSTKPAVRFELVGAESTGWFDSWYVERARALIRDAQTTHLDYAAEIKELEAAFNSSLRTLDERAEAQLLELDRQLATIHDLQRTASELLGQAGITTAPPTTEVEPEPLRPARPESTDLASFVDEAQRQLRLLQTVLNPRRQHGERDRNGIPVSTVRWRWGARLAGGACFVQAITTVLATGNVALAAGGAALGCVLVALGVIHRSAPPSAEPAESGEPVRRPPSDLSPTVRQAEERYQQLTTAIEEDARAQRSHLIHQLLAEKKERSARRERRLTALQPVLVDLRSDLLQLSPPWGDAWRAWQPATTFGQAARIGELIDPAARIPLPLLFPLPGERGLVIKTTSDGKRQAAAMVQSLLLRLLATTPPGNLQLSLVDPIGLGQNVAGFLRLSDYDERLTGGKAATEAQQIERQLVELTGHIENVIQRYLRNEYATIEEYNREAGEIAEPYRLLTIFDFPVNFSETAARRLLSIIKNGPRCGVYTVLVLDQAQPLPRGFDVHEIELSAMVITWNGERFVWQEDGFEQCAVYLDEPPAPECVQRIIDGVGAASRAAGTVEVPFSRIAPEREHWWRAGSGDGLRAPLGPSGARSVQQLGLGSGTAQHALVAGKTGSGKSTLLHTLITSLALTYSPDEVQFYLIDFKQGVEFKLYAEEALPHARVIAIESEREFGVSVLQGLDDELARRGERFRALGVDNLADYRAQVTDPMPRILLVVDEFQEFFTDDDQIAVQAAQLLDRLVRQGRAFGLHVLLGTQTLAGTYSLARGTIDQMTVRIALQCSDADSRLILADDNPAARLLSRPGEAIYNAANGLIEGNTHFQTAWLPDDEQRRYLSEIKRLAGNLGYQPSEPPIIFEGNAAADITHNRQLTKLLEHPPERATSRLMTWLGDPVSVREPVAATFQRQSGSNLLIVGQNAAAAQALLSIATVSLAAQLPLRGTPPHSLSLLDFVTADATDAAYFATLRDTAHLPLRLGQRRHLPQAINELAAEVQRRLDRDLTGEAPYLLFIYGLHRARDLRPEDGFGFPSFEAEPAAPNLAEQFELILREGPELGIHTIVWCDTMTNLARSLDRRTLREFGL
ncbi:MAG TPA: FtsK/SpoIIIE domain-containing protein, partial [Nitrolancea sp.]|nr:FtsK/SpoIIIE domain-containing protein [Nitrolancea sp.]